VETIVKNNPKKTVDRLLERPQWSSGNLAQDVGYLWRDLPVPVIAVLHGMCYGGGMQIALGADFRFTTPDCRLSIMEAKWGKSLTKCAPRTAKDQKVPSRVGGSSFAPLIISLILTGLIPDMSASVTLRELVRMDVAKELTMTGRILDGREAASLGLVTRCVVNPMAEAEKLAVEIVQR
jgi:enoyl-CoA hydratase/carnithine racemase